MATMNIFTGTFKWSNDMEVSYLHHFKSPPANLETKILFIFSHKHYTFDPDGWVWLVCWPIVTWVTNGPWVRPVMLLTLEPKMLTLLFPWVWWFDGLILWTRGRVGKLFTPPLLPLRLFCWSKSCICEVRMWWLLPFTLTMWVLLLEPYFELVEDWYGCW